MSISGVRGVVSKDLTLKDFFEIAKAFALQINRGRCVIGRDTRSTSDMASKIVIAALLSQGCSVYDQGVASTPSLFRKVSQNKLDGGLIITASHNPPEWNGLKFIIRGGRGIFEDELDQLKGKLFREKTENDFTVGEYVALGTNTYTNDVVSYVGRGICRPIKVALDLGGGAGCLIAPTVFRELGCQVASLHSIAGMFQRTIDPVSDNLSTLSRFIVNEGCDIGFAYDCDADRVVVVDDNGRKLSPDDTLLLCIKHLIKSMSPKDVVVSIDTSIAVDDIVSKAGGHVYRTKIGEANVVQEIIRSKSVLGGEGSSGGLIVPDFALCRDGVLASALITKIVKEEGGIRNALSDLPRYHQIRRKIPYEKKKIEFILDELSEDEVLIDRIDGLRVRFKDSSWVLIRPSRTENTLRISVESKDTARAKFLMANYLAKVRRLLEVTG